MIKIYDYITDLIENYISLDIQLNLFFIIEDQPKACLKT